jgi:hypothetical protein
MNKGNSLRAHSVIKQVPLGKIRVSQLAQRELKEYRVHQLLSEFDLEQFGLPVVNYRDGHYYVIDGQHRIETMKRFLGDGWEIQHIDCRAYTGLTEVEEANMFDRLNNVLAVHTFDKFKVRVTAGRPVESSVKKVVEGLGLCISRESVPGAVGAVGTLVRIHQRSDPKTLERALKIVRDSFGDAGMEARIIDGIGHLCQRYNGALDDTTAVERLGGMRGGVGGLLNRAEVLRKQTGNQISHCVAAAAVDVINAKRSGKKLPSWWKAE